MRKHSFFIRLISLTAVFALCLSILSPHGRAESDSGILDSDTLQAMVDEAIDKFHAEADYVSVCCCYVNTGDTWYYNPDHWYYAASLYKVPMMMLLTERISSGELTEESKIDGTEISVLADKILLMSNNQASQWVLDYLGGSRKCMNEYKKYSSMADDEYDASYLRAGNFNVRFMTEIMKTLYEQPDRFPGVLDRMLQAQPGQYLKKDLGDSYPIAQKYGSVDMVIHASGIIYTPNPIIITIMTEFMGNRDALIGELAKNITEYCLTLEPGSVAVQQTPAPAPEVTEQPGKLGPAVQIPALLPVDNSPTTSIFMFILSLLLIGLVAGGIYYLRKKSGTRRRRHHHHHR